MSNIRPSPELAAVAIRWLKALRDKDHGALKNLFFASEHIRYVGSSYDEFWGGEILRDGYGDHADEVPDFTIEDVAAEAFECGQAGWATWRGEICFTATGSLSVERFSWVFLLEDGAWKIVQIHVSNPTSNIDKIGVEHSALDRLLQAAKEGFRPLSGSGTTTVMFTDIADSSAIANALGDLAWADAINRHLSAVADIIERQNGNVVKTLGDGTMSTFATAREAMATALEIQDLEQVDVALPSLRVRIGLHTGDVVESNGDFFGTVVNKAARIAASAGPGQILVSEATRAMVEGSKDFIFESPIKVALRGIEGEHLISTLKSA